MKENIEIVEKFVYLGITFTTGGSFNETHKTFSGQGLKVSFKLNQYLYNFTDLSVWVAEWPPFGK